MTVTTVRDERGLLAALSLEDKVRLLTGADNWRTRSLPAIGLRAMVVSDGGSPSTCSASCTWHRSRPACAKPTWTWS
jgi:hypothetical protein